MAAIAPSNRLDQSNIHPGERLAGFHLVRRNFEEVIDPANRQPKTPGADVHHQQRPLMLRKGLPIEQPVRINDRQQRPTDIDQSDDGIGGTRDPGGRKGRQYFAGTAGEHPAGQIAHLKYHDAHRRGVSHLY